MKKIITIADAIISLGVHPITVQNDGVDINNVQIDWHGNTPKNNSEIEAERQRLQAIEDAK
tara:strand:+ start:476 stop:658 length:183 start_codon:yes stop_codon:yes gene_type:complete